MRDCQPAAWNVCLARQLAGLSYNYRWVDARLTNDTYQLVIKDRKQPEVRQEVARVLPFLIYLPTLEEQTA